jgi:N-acetylglucosaminyl-diphospho-decaprenol L-rhamnosyltransferase
MPAVDISVIIVTYNSADCIAACVQSVLAQTEVSFEVLVVDNASADGTLARLKGLPCRVIASAENLGFGRGNNLGFAGSSGRYIYLLNPDAKLAAKNSLAELCRRMDANPRWGMAGTEILSADGRAQGRPATDYPGSRHVHRDFSKLPGDIAWIMGASMFIRRELYEKLGGFDPGFFLYSEETDFCLRLRELGFVIGYVSEVAVNHIGGASEDLRDPYDVSARKLKGLLRFRQKHYSSEDCGFLARRDLRRARWRMFWNGLLARIQPPRSRAWQKHRQYRAIWEVTREHLAGVK